jgi:hypothetical protein
MILESGWTDESVPCQLRFPVKVLRSLVTVDLLQVRDSSRIADIDAALTGRANR